tara:strand:- start:319 stop:924 length:606 start_codon:yes stop_codon:yes gene_type:complete
MASVKSLCDRGIVLENGLSVFEGEVEKAINFYLSNERKVIPKDLSTVENRSGTRLAKFKSFEIIHPNGQTIESVLSGDSVIFTFTLDIINPNKSLKVDLGFSIHTPDDELVSVLYSSYQNEVKHLEGSGCYTMECKIEELPLNEGEYIVKGRIECDKVESDWPKFPLGKFNVVKGDFYKTGNLGFNGKSKLLIKGEWGLKI